MSRTQKTCSESSQKPEELANYQSERRKRRRRLFIFCGLALALLALIVVGFFVDISPGGKINISSFDKIGLGMPYRKVEAILGPPGDYRTKAAQGDGEDFAAGDELDASPIMGLYLRLWHGDMASIKIYFSFSNSEDYVDHKVLYCRPRAQMKWWCWVVAEQSLPPRVINDGTAVFHLNESTGEDDNLVATIEEMHWRRLHWGEKRLEITFSLAWKPGAKGVKALGSVSRVWFLFWPSEDTGGQEGDDVGAIETPIYLGDSFIKQKVHTFEQTSTIVVPAKAGFIQMCLPYAPSTIMVPLPPREEKPSRRRIPNS